MRIAFCASLALVLVGCGGKQPAQVSHSDAEFHKKLQLQLIEAKPGDVIELRPRASGPSIARSASTSRT
jgi:PBP1b-binding outer membrane lipoprotein LpoB